MTWIRKHFYGASAITLGAWEATAYASGKRVPTVSAVTCKARRKNRLVTLLAVSAWAAGLIVHLARHELGDG